MNYLSPAWVVEELARRTALPPATIRSVLQAQAESAYAYARWGFPIPGIGVLFAYDRPERKLATRSIEIENEREITVQFKGVLQFRLAQAAVDICFGPSASTSDVLDVPLNEFTTHPQE